MGKKVNKKVGLEGIRSRKYIAVLYPQEDETHKEALKRIQQGYCLYMANYHDMDIDSEGNKEKTHLQLVLSFENARYLTAVANALGIQPYYLEVCDNYYGSLRYLIHLDNPEKYQYLDTLPFGTLQADYNKAIRLEVTEESQALQIINFIYSKDSYLSFKELTLYTVKNGVYQTFRRNSNIFRMILEEHNNPYVNRY